MNLTLDDILDAARKVEMAGVESWNDVDRLDSRAGSEYHWPEREQRFCEEGASDACKKAMA